MTTPAEQIQQLLRGINGPGNDADRLLELERAVRWMLEREMKKTQRSTDDGRKTEAFKTVQKIVAGFATFSPADVRRWAPDIDAKQINNILGYMARSGRIKRMGRGEYKRTENVHR